MLRRIRTFFSLSGEKRGLALEAAVWLATARLSLLLVPFPTIGRYIGSLRPPAPADVGLPVDETVARKVGWAVNLVADRSPLKLVCLPRAMAAWMMLHRRGIGNRLHFGAMRKPEDNSLLTHAWLSSGRVEVTGYPVAHECVEMGYFSR